jgi:SAM-dependent methyltransferase
VLEIGCGNGRLLVSLARAGHLTSGHGIDLADSRVRFAREWADDLGLGDVRFEVGDALEMPIQPVTYDTVVCITGALGYFEPLAQGSAAALLSRWAAELRAGGLLVLELYPHPELRPVLDASGGSVRLWRELEPPDPWRFYLSDLRLIDGVLVHEKTFIHRTTGLVDSGRSERLKLYSQIEIEELLERAGFGEIRCFEGWSRQAYAGGETLVVTARRSS